MKVYEGQLVSENQKFCIILSRFNDFIGSKLLDGAVDELKRHGVDEDNIEVVRVPGAFEIPLAALKFAKSGRYDAVITLGAIIRGATSHYEHVSAELSKGIAAVSLKIEVTVI